MDTKLVIHLSHILFHYEDKKPGTAAGMDRSIVLTVYLATSSGLGVGTSRPCFVVVMESILYYEIVIDLKSIKL